MSQNGLNKVWLTGNTLCLKGLLRVALVVVLHGLNEHSGRYDEFAKQLNTHGYKVYGMDWVGKFETFASF
ncbi:putative triacylglycerol lipase [Helianthus annuus]|nr:putative triacylglycerol lipase [Helianthus annuus]